MEVKVFREPLAIGLFLMVVWFMKKLDGNVGKGIVTEAGEELPEEALKVAPSTIYKWAHYEFIPHLKVGRTLRFEERAVQKWLPVRIRGCREANIHRLANSPSRFMAFAGERWSEDLW